MPSKKTPTTLVTFLLDRSSSMNMCRAATIEAFNAYLHGLKEETKAKINFTLLQFDSYSLDKCHVNVPVNDVPGLTNDTYQPRGGTPLIDAAVKTIHAVDAALKARDDKPKVVVCVQTDGQENESREHTWEELKGLVTAKTAEGWEFNFMGTGIEGYDQAARMGIAASSTMSYDAQNIAATRSAFHASAQNTASFAAGRSANTQYSVEQKLATGDRHAARWDARMSAGPLQVDLTVAGPVATPVVQPAKPAATPRRSSVPDFAL